MLRDKSLLAPFVALFLPFHFALAMLPLSFGAGGGGWHSSGGEIFRDAKNPWFVRNATAVRYCISVDSKGISASESKVKADLRAALDYWKNEMQRTLLPPSGAAEIGSPDFVEVECASGVAEISFLVGFDSLAGPEREYLIDPRKFIGVTVRTDYDSVHLKGEGFVFIASDRGPNSYVDPALGDASTLVPEAWSKPNLLRYAFLHEIGHVFGVPHAGAGLMSEVFLERLVDLKLYELFGSSAIEPFFFPPAATEDCLVHENAFFGADLDSPCLSIDLPRPSQLDRLPVYEVNTVGGTRLRKLIGEIRNLKSDFMNIQHRPAIFIQLPAEQSVFTQDEAAYRSFMIGGMFFDGTYAGTYVPAAAGGRPKNVSVRITSNTLVVEGAVGGMVTPVFNYSSWLNAKLFFSGKPSF